VHTGSAAVVPSAVCPVVEAEDRVESFGEGLGAVGAGAVGAMVSTG